MAIELPTETKDRLIASIKRYFEEALGLEVGDLKASLWLDYALEEIGPSIYNQAIADARARMGEMVDEIDSTCYEAEFRYWEKRAPKR